jgi:hypothetical protein
MLAHLGLKLLFKSHQVLLISVEALIELLLGILFSYLRGWVVEISLVVRFLGLSVLGV